MKTKHLLYPLLMLFVLAGACAPRVDRPPPPQSASNTTPTLPASNTTPTLPASNATPTLPAKQGGTPPVTVSASAVVETTLNQEVALKVGQTAIVTNTPDRFGITFYSVKQDSRCPQGAQCIVAGEVVVLIAFEENGLPHPPLFELTSDLHKPNHSIVIEDYLVELVAIQPPRVLNVEIAPGDYIGTFKISPAAQAAATPTAGAPSSTPPYPTPVAQLTASLDEPIVLKMFQTVAIQDEQLNITLSGVFEDSRCPRQVQCAQAGRALVAFTLYHDGQIGNLVLSTQPPDGRTIGYFNGYSMELTDVQPYPETPEQKIQTTDYAATIVVRKAEPPTTVNKNEGMVLKVGQTGTIADENVQLTFEAVESDSRCPHMVACAVRGNAVVRAKLTFADGTTQSFVLNTDSGKPGERIPDTGRFGLELVVLNPYPQVNSPPPAEMQSEYEATLVLRKFATAVQPTSPPADPVACLGLTPQDAEAILGHAVEPSPAGDVRIFANPFDDDSQRETAGLCGYVSTAPGSREDSGRGEPRLNRTERVHALTAARVSGAQALELLRVADLVRASDPDGDSTPYLILLTRLTAGDWEGTFETLQELPHASTKVKFEQVDSFGDEGLWIWREGAADNYAALLVRDKNSFVMLEGLMDKANREAAAHESMRAAMAKIVE